MPRTVVTAKPYLRPTGPNANRVPPGSPALHHYLVSAIQPLRLRQHPYSFFFLNSKRHFTFPASPLPPSLWAFPICPFVITVFPHFLECFLSCLHLVFLLCGTGILPSCMCATQAYSACRAQERAPPGTGITDSSESPYRCWKLT